MGPAENVMTEEQKANIKTYEDLKIKEKEIKASLETLKPLILPLLKEGEVLNAEFGRFEVKKRDNWKYSEETTALENTLKDKKAEEVAKGIAVSTPTVFFEYRAND